MKATFLLLLLASPLIAASQTRPVHCQVRPLWEIKDGVRSANLGSMGEFQTDGREGITMHSFKFEKTGLVVTAGVDSRFDYSRSNPRPLRIDLAITVSDQEKKDIFESVDSSEASTLYRRNWNLQVTKNISFENRTYMFTLSCWDASSGASPKP